MQSLSIFRKFNECVPVIYETSPYIGIFLVIVYDGVKCRGRAE